MEYLQRHGLLRAFFRPPCSFPTYRPGINGDLHRKMVAVHSIEGQDTLLVKIWHVDTHPLESPLPPFDSTPMTADDVLAGKAIPDGFHLLTPGLRNSIPADLNVGKRPPREKTFNEHYDNLLADPCRHERLTHWLWECFRRAFSHRLKINFEFEYKYLPLNVLFENEMYTVRQKYPRYWQYFDMWKMHMINFDVEVAPELLLA